jgi:hypothetical protein
MVEQKKICPRCNLAKPLNEFCKRKDKGSKIGVVSHCRNCKNKAGKEYRQTKDGLICRIYNCQRRSSKRRGHDLPLYTLQELRNWCFNQEIFHELFEAWKESGFQGNLTPSCDRMNDYEGYSLGRLQLVTWSKNNQKAHIDRKNGVNNKVSKSIIGKNKITGDKVEFYSGREASRKTGIFQSAISACCTGKTKSAGGYYWKYKEADDKKANPAIYDEMGKMNSRPPIERWRINRQIISEMR